MASYSMPLWVLTVLAAACAAACDHHGQTHVHDHHVASVRALEAATSSRDTDTAYLCPVCGMSSTYSDYNNSNFVALQHGQRVYTCGMSAHAFSDYSFKSTDTAYLAANMAAYVVNSTDSEGYSSCEDSCPECADGLYDPVSGDQVTAVNYHYVCLSKGQKIYFASLAAKNTYLSNVNQQVRYLVETSVCSDSSCSDATQITALSAAASAMVPEIEPSSDSGDSSTARSTTGSADTSALTSTTDAPFCSGEGSVMFNGFQSTIDGTCVKLLFQPWVLNSALKYAFGFLGCFFVPVFNELLVKVCEAVRQRLLSARKLRSRDKLHRLRCKALLAMLYMVQMAIAYFAMLVAMTYETGLFIALLFGFGAGFLLFRNFDKDVTGEPGVWRFADPSTVFLRIRGMTCKKNCGAKVEAALQSVPGVTNTFVVFDDKTAYVAGSAALSDLADAVTAAGYSVVLDAGTTSCPI